MKDELKVKREYLERYGYIKAEMKPLMEEYTKWSNMRDRITQLSDGMPHVQSNGSKPENVALEIQTILEQLSDCVKADSDALNSISATISHVFPYRYRNILTMRYISGMSVNQIAQSIGKDREKMYVIIDNAVKAINIPE